VITRIGPLRREQRPGPCPFGRQAATLSPEGARFGAVPTQSCGKLDHRERTAVSLPTPGCRFSRKHLGPRLFSLIGTRGRPTNSTGRETSTARSEGRRTGRKISCIHPASPRRTHRRGLDPQQAHAQHANGRATRGPGHPLQPRSRPTISAVGFALQVPCQTAACPARGSSTGRAVIPDESG